VLRVLSRLGSPARSRTLPANASFAPLMPLAGPRGTRASRTGDSSPCHPQHTFR